MNFPKYRFLLLFLITSSLVELRAQHLNVEGQSRIRGKLDLGHMTDSASIIVGLGAGLNTDFSNNDSINTGPALTFLGAYAGHLNTTGFYNTASGFRALYSNSTGKNNTANGVFSLEGNQTGVSNTAMGAYSLKSNDTGGTNTALGASALEFNNTGSANTGVGSGALKVNTSGYENTATGAAALQSNTTGFYNTATGTAALFNNHIGVSNTATGYQCMYLRRAGSGNTASGLQSLYSDSIGSNNTSCGYQALYHNKTGSQNTALGSNAYFTGNNLSNTTCIGYNSGRIANASNRIEIGNSSVSWIGGQVAWSTYSDRRIKNNITENVPGLSFINLLRPVTYNLDIHRQNNLCHADQNKKADWDEKYLIEESLMTGFIAQEVEEASQVIDYNFSGVHKARDTVGIYSLRYSEFVVPLVKAVQDLSEINNQQNDLLAALQMENIELRSKMEEIIMTLNSNGIDADCFPTTAKLR